MEAVSKPTSAPEYFAKAERALEGARALLAISDAEGACSRAFYAVFDAAHAALIAEGFGEALAGIKTHNGLLSYFSRELVRTERVAIAFGKTLNQVQRLRLAADYFDEPLSLPDASWAVDGHRSFSQLLRRWSPEHEGTTTATARTGPPVSPVQIGDDHQDETSQRHDPDERA